MYDLNDNSRAILEIQRYLFVISEEYPERLKVPLDGVYSSQTRDSVREFQLIYGLPPSGNVDKETFDLIYKEYDAANKKSDFNNELLNTGKELKLGDSGLAVGFLNYLILALSKYYIDLPEVKEGTFFSKLTEDAVKYLQGIYGEAKSGSVNIEFFERLKSELGARKELIP